MASSAVELAVGYISIIPEMRGVGPAVRRSLGEAENEAGRSGRRMGDQMSEGIGSTMKKAMLGAGVAAGALLAKGLMDSMDKEVSVDKLSASLGATAEQSEAYGRIAGKVYAQAYGENLGEVTTAIDAVASSLKGVGGANIDDGSLDRLTKKALDFSAVYGTEVADSTQAVNQLMTSGLAKSADEGFDLLVASYQKVPAAMRDEIPDLMNEYGTFFSSLGFNGQEAFGVLVNASEQGAIAMDKVGDALKETGIRATDVGDKAAMEALTGIGLNATDTANALLAGGDKAKKAYGQMVDGLLKIKDPSVQAAQAVALFGTPLEDLNKAEIPAFLQAMSGAGTAMDGFGGSADRMGATLSDNAATKIESFKRTVSEGLTNLVGGVIMPAIDAIFGGIGGILGPVLTEVQGGITAFVAAFKDGGDEVTSSGFAGFLEGLGVTARNLYDTWNTTILPIVKEVGAVVLDVGQTALPILWGAFTNGVSIVNGLVAAITASVDWFREHQVIAGILATVITVGLLPALTSMTVGFVASSAAAVTSGATTAAIWTMLQASAVKSAAIQVVSQYKTVAGWVAMSGSAVANAATTSAAWVGAQARAGAGWVAMQAKAIGSFIATAASATAQAAITAGQWVAANARIVASFVATRAVMIASAVATGAMTAAQWALNVALNANPIGIIIVAVAALVAGLIYFFTQTELGKRIVQAAWEGIQAAVSFAWNNVIKPIFDFFVAGVHAVGDGTMWLWNNAIVPAFNGIRSIIELWWAGVQVAFDLFKSGVQALGDIAMWLWNNAIQPAFDGIGNAISWVWTNVISPAFEALKSGVQGVGDFFGNVVDGIAATWDRVKEIVRKPIEFLVNTIYNKGIVPAWNNVAGFIGLDDKKLSPIEGFATGGIYPGYTPGRDTGVIAVGGGEAIMRPEWTRAVGSGYVDNANAAARNGGVGGVRKFLGAFADGGIVDSMKRIVDAKFPGMQLTSGLRFTDSGYHSKGMAADFSNGSDSTAEMRSLAGFIADNYAPQTVELIHDPFNRNIGGGQDVGDGYGFYGAGTMGEHRNHVHWAVKEALGAPSGGIISKIGDAIGSTFDWARGKVADLFEKPIRAIGENIPDFGGLWGQVPRKAYDKIADAAIGFVSGKAGEVGSQPGIPGGGAEQWRSMAMQALAHTGFVPPERYVENMLKQIQSESGGNPSIVQSVQDVNSGGNEAAGLLQVIPGTFAAYRDPSLPNDRTDPYANMVAALNYVRSTYGDPNSVWGKGHGYDSGGIFPNNSFGINMSGKPEAVLTNDQWQLFSAFNKTLEEVGPKFMEKMADIAPKAGLEILGLEGTLLDPSHRYYTAARDIAKTASEFQAKRTEAQPEQSQTSNDFSITIGQVVNPDPNQVARNLTDMQGRQSMRYAGRPM